MTPEIDNIVSYFYHKYKGENSFKILTPLREHFVGISKQPMERCQIDLVVFEKTPSKDENGNIYNYVLSCLDVFSQYIFLWRLKSKDTIEGANQLKEIFMTFGSPKILQCDKGSEFQGILPVIYCLHLLTGQ